MLASVVLATRRGRAMACVAWGRPLPRAAMLMVLPSLALGFEWKVGGLFDAAGWLGQPEPLGLLLYKRLPLFAIALPLLAVFVHGARRRQEVPASAPSIETPVTLTVGTSWG